MGKRMVGASDRSYFMKCIEEYSSDSQGRYFNFAVTWVELGKLQNSPHRVSHTPHMVGGGGSCSSALCIMIMHCPQDIQAHHPAQMASFTSDTLEHDIAPLHGQEQIAVYNMCTDTTRNMNGIVTNMHPGEGIWLFRYVLDHFWPTTVYHWLKALYYHSCTSITPWQSA